MMLAQLMVSLSWIAAGAAVSVGLIVFALRSFMAPLGVR